MRTIARKSLYGRNVHMVVLTEDEEKHLPHSVLVSMADGLSKERAMEIHHKGLSTSHFGGHVEIITAKEAEARLKIQDLREPWMISDRNPIDPNAVCAQIAVYID